MHVKDFKEMNAASQADVSSCMVDWTLQSCGFNWMPISMGTDG